METQIMKIRVSPEVLTTIIHEVEYSGETFGVYSGMTQTLRGGPNDTSLLTGLTVPILLVENTVDVGYYSVFDGALSQQNVVTNFIFSSTTSDPYTWYVYNTADIEFNSYLELSSYFIDWGDNSQLEPITSYTPNSISHQYNTTPSGYTITMYQNNPWGNTTVSKKIQTPYVNVPDFNPNGTAYFTPNVGSWSATPISYNFIFSGDSVNLVDQQVSSDYVTVPFTVSGLTDSRINDLSGYGANQFQLLVPVQRNGEDYGIITEMNLIFTAYTIQNVDYYDYSDGTTIYFTQSSGLTANWMVQEPLVKDELLLGVISDAEVQTNVFIERGKNSAYERIQRIGEVDNLGDLIKYGYRFFNVV
jgi:hypothetical protein